MTFQQNTVENPNVTSFPAMTTNDNPRPSTNSDMDKRLAPHLKLVNELGQKQLLENKKSRQRQWTDEKRAQQSAKILQLKPWLHSTGPKTAEGKAKIAHNAWKHGLYSGAMKHLNVLLRAQKQFVKSALRQRREKYRAYLENRAIQSAMNKPLNAFVSQISSFLAEGGLNVSKREIKMMVENVTGYGEDVFITAPETPLSADQQETLQKIAKRRVGGEPLTRILGVCEFWGLEFEVTPDVLDPRPDTETLIEAVLSYVKKNPLLGEREARSESEGIRILDLGTGTGCIPIALLSELPKATAVATDISPEALAVARRNSEKHKMSDRLEFVQSDWFENLEDQEFDLILSNPPYISNEVIPNLDDEVKNHDPILALSGGDSGLECYKKIISALKVKLKGESRAFLEIGFDQLESVSRLVDDSGLRVVGKYHDLAGNPRVVEIAAALNGDK